MEIVAHLAKSLQVLFVLYVGLATGQKFVLIKGEGNNYVLKPAGMNEQGPGVVDIKNLPPIPVNDKPIDAPGTNSQTNPSLGAVCIDIHKVISKD